MLEKSQFFLSGGPNGRKCVAREIEVRLQEELPMHKVCLLEISYRCFVLFFRPLTTSAQAE